MYKSCKHTYTYTNHESTAYLQGMVVHVCAYIYIYICMCVCVYCDIRLMYVCMCVYVSM